VALLNGPGVEIFSTETGALVNRVIIPEPFGSAGGFVESVYLPDRQELWVSQMNTNRVHGIDGTNFTYLGAVSTGGGWPKVVTPSRDEKFLYASNWTGENIGIIDLENRRLAGTIPVSGIPRGMAFGADDTILYVCIYGTGNIEKIDVNRRISLGVLPTGPGAARHIVYDPLARLFYVSDMLTGRVYSLNETTGRVENSLRIGPNLNTIKLSASGDYLFISSRGRNNPETYLRKGPDFGTVTVLDTRSFTVVERIYGGNQTTGLAIRQDRLVFSDFKDDRLEFYRVPGLE
jgi:DNA-binding beta-propeller fold protein YncE